MISRPMRQTVRRGARSPARRWRCGATAGIPSETEGPLETWREWCDSVEGHGIDSGHFMAEENPQATLAALLPFLETPCALTGSRPSPAPPPPTSMRRRWKPISRGMSQGFAGPLTLARFKGGQSNPTYKLTTPARAYVLRRKPFGKLLPSAHAIEREYRVTEALAQAGFPVARPLHLCTDDERHRRGLLCDGACRGPGVLGAACAGAFGR